MLRVRSKKMTVISLDPESESIEVRGRDNSGRRYDYHVPYNKAMQMVEGQIAYVVHPTLIRKYYSREEFKRLLFNRFSGKCFYCGENAETIDHVIPKSAGGITSFANCVPASKKCNEAKSSMSLNNFLYYFEPTTETPWITNEDYVRNKLKEVKHNMDLIDQFLRVCLKKMSPSDGFLKEIQEWGELKREFEELKATMTALKKEEGKKLPEWNLSDIPRKSLNLKLADVGLSYGHRKLKESNEFLIRKLRRIRRWPFDIFLRKN